MWMCSRWSAGCASAPLLFEMLVGAIGLFHCTSEAVARTAVMGPNEMAVVINESDPLSVAVGAYYQARRRIPAANVIRVRFATGRSAMSVAEFAGLKAEVDSKTPPSVQAFVLTWTSPYRVECMSITTAFAAGFNPEFCGSGCAATRLSPYFDSNSRRPFDDLGWRPTMSIAARNFAKARQLIDRGIAADGRHPLGTAYLVSTDDVNRNVRAASYEDARLLAGNRIRVKIVKAADMRGRSDVMFYFIGAPDVRGLDTDRFLPGAVGDHLTSFGGDLAGHGQMSSLRWLEAGTTGSYGTVVEPCNFTAKFPNVSLMMKRYLDGESLIESYWKSVAMPGQGLFLGEPLAAPYR